MASRSFPVPENARHGLLATANATLDELDLAAQTGNRWARKIVVKENERIVASVLGDDNRLPVGVLADGSDDAVVGLYRCGNAWRGSEAGWIALDDGEGLRAHALDVDDVAFIARALDEGADSVVLRPVVPAAFIAAADDGESMTEVPDGAKVIAVVDDLDKSAVMDLVIVLPGPEVMRRHAGEWREDDKWLTVLRSVTPPPIVVLEASQIDGVVAQIDAITKDTDWVETDTDDYLNASGWSRADRMSVEFAIARSLVAAPAGKAASKATPGGRMPAKLQKYWTVGPGAAKIRWGTPGAWRRCHRYLTKYMGPFRSKGACTNLSQKLGGHGVATHVGS
jgi:hypothetical protein